MNMNLGMDDLTIGASSQGTMNYLEELKTTVVDSICKDIDDISRIEQAINNCWQGASKDRFMDAFKQARDLVKDGINHAYTDLENMVIHTASELIEADASGIYDYQ